MCTPETLRFICACAISVSKSDTARRPLMMKSAPTSFATSTTSFANCDDPDVAQVGERLLDHRLTLVEREERLALLRVAHRGDHDVVEQVRGRLDQLAVSVVERVERARVEHGGHGERSSGSARREREMVTTVLP